VSGRGEPPTAPRLDVPVTALATTGIRLMASRAAYEAKTLVALHPAVALTITRLRRHGVLLSPDTDVLIEGYPRSANSFAVAAFTMAQPAPVQVAHHVHAPAHVIAAVRAGVPALVLVRDPEEAVLELVISKPNLTVRQALRGYVRFYRPLLPYREGFVTATFAQVTSDFGAVIRRLNERFGTSFREFEHTEENVRACFDAMDGYWRGRVGSGHLLERIVGRPSTVREEMKEPLRHRYHISRLCHLRERAERTFEMFGLVAAGHRRGEADGRGQGRRPA
jgi:hypothetical protein